MSEKSHYKRILQLTLPVMVSGLAQNIIHVTDTAFMTRLGEAEVGASAIAGLYYLTLIFLGFGLGVGSQILIARRCGEGRYDEVGKIFANLIYVFLALGIVLFVIIRFFSRPILTSLVDSPEILARSLDYLDWRAWGALFALLSFAARFLYTGIAKTSSLGINTAFLAVVNAVAAYGLIFGKWGLPQMGIAGAGLAAVIAEVTSCVFFFVYTGLFLDMKKYCLMNFTLPDFSLIRRVFVLSLPMVILYAVSLAGWFSFFLIVEKLGPHNLAISNIVRSIYMVYFMPLMSFQSVTNTLVSHAIGEGRPHEVGRIIRSILFLCLGIGTVCALINFIFPLEVFGLLSPDPILARDAVPTLRVVSLALLLFSIGTVLFNAVSGTGDTKASLVIELTSVTAYLIYAGICALVLKTDIATVWSAEWAYWSIQATLSFWRLKSGKWRRLKI